jgi:hypothetical protein
MRNWGKWTARLHRAFFSPPQVKVMRFRNHSMRTKSVDKKRENLETFADNLLVSALKNTV